MLGDNIKALRKQKGFTQEEFAKRLNVVRQTVSKWEKGLSVPDAQTVNRMAEELDVSVQEILGAELKEENNKNEIAEQLARINEYLAVRNYKSVRRWKTASIILALLLAVSLAALLFFKISGQRNMTDDSDNAIPDTVSANSINVDVNKSKISFCPSIAKSDYTYTIVYMSEDFNYMDAIRQTAVYENGVCTAAIPAEVKNTGKYSVSLIVGFGAEERTVQMLSDFIIEGNNVSYTIVAER